MGRQGRVIPDIVFVSWDDLPGKETYATPFLS